MSLPFALLLADPWYLQVRAAGPYLPSVVLVTLLVVLGILSAMVGRRLGCPPVTRERLRPGVAPEQAFRDALLALQAAGLRIDSQQPGIRIQAFEGGHGRSYQRMPKEVEVRFFEEPEGTRVAVTVSYRLIIVVDSGEGRYGADLAGRVAGEESPVAARYGVPLAFHLAAATALGATTVLGYVVAVEPGAWLPLAFEANAAILAAVVLSALALLQSIRGRRMVRGRGAAAALLLWTLGLLVFWTLRYLLYI